MAIRGDEKASSSSGGGSGGGGRGERKQLHPVIYKRITGEMVRRTAIETK